MNESYEIIKDYYLSLKPLMAERFNKFGPIAWIDPYTGKAPWQSMMSPIERITWDKIRKIGHAPLYSQYPVLDFFIDFANPFVKIGIECDGKNFHQDKEKDKKRDERLFREGWKIFRITGSDCYREEIDDLISSLSIWYFGGWPLYFQNSIEFVEECLNKRISIGEIGERLSWVFVKYKI